MDSEELVEVGLPVEKMIMSIEGLGENWLVVGLLTATEVPPMTTKKPCILVHAKVAPSVVRLPHSN